MCIFSGGISEVHGAFCDEMHEQMKVVVQTYHDGFSGRVGRTSQSQPSAASHAK